MQTRVNVKSLFRVGIAIGLLAMIAFFAQRVYNGTSTETPVVAQSEEWPTPQPVVVTNGEPAVEHPWLYTANDQTYSQDGVTCQYMDDAGLAFCERFVKEILRRRGSGHYRQSAPVSVANTSYTPGRVTNYVPAHWPAELRAILQAPASRNLQTWVQQNLQ